MTKLARCALVLTLIATLGLTLAVPAAAGQRIDLEASPHRMGEFDYRSSSAIADAASSSASRCSSPLPVRTPRPRASGSGTGRASVWAKTVVRDTRSVLRHLGHDGRHRWCRPMGLGRRDARDQRGGSDRCRQRGATLHDGSPGLEDRRSSWLASGPSVVSTRWRDEGADRPGVGELRVIEP